MGWLTLAEMKAIKRVNSCGMTCREYEMERRIKLILVNNLGMDILFLRGRKFLPYLISFSLGVRYGQIFSSIFFFGGQEFFC